MPDRLSEIFGVDLNSWDATGAFDAFVGVDAQLHIDPHLLASTKAPAVDLDRTHSARGASQWGRRCRDAHVVGALRARGYAESGAREERRREHESHD